MTRTRIILLILIGLATFRVDAVEAEPVLKVGEFSAAAEGMALPAGWEPLVFPKITRHTRYTLVQDNGTRVIEAVSAASASGLIRRLEIDPRRFPVIAWRWKITAVLTKGDLTQKAGDDYPARIYVTFTYDPSKLGFIDRTKYKAARLFYGQYPPTGTITYVWANKAPVGTTAPNPYTDRVRMVVVESGAAKSGQWVDEERNVYNDYLEAFGQEPPLISGVALMTDTDNTGEEITAYYGDILFRAE